MDRFLKKRAQEGLVGKGQEHEPPGGDRGSPRKRPRLGDPTGPSWRHIAAEGLDCDYTVLFGKAEADEILRELEEEVEYFTGKQKTVCVDTLAIMFGEI
jgi:alpha-ketoglutarate-dependent dioxygenase alkB family protein 2